MLTKQQIQKLEIDQFKNIHFIGMISGFNSFCATVLLNSGINVTASEYVQNDPRRKYWEDKKVLCPGGHDAKNVNENIDLIVYPNGPIPGNPECEKAEELNIPAITISQLTGILSRKYKTIAIAGTHGKTTTAAMIVWLLSQTIGEPNFIIGDKVLDINKDWNISTKSEYLVLEACEYKRQFLDRAPTPFISVITHIGLDHTDYYKNQEDYNSAFVEFLNNTQSSIIIDDDGSNEPKVLGKLNFNNPELQIIRIDDLREEFKNLEIPVLGDHNRENMLRAFGVGKTLKISSEDIKKALSCFPGVASRFEQVGETSLGSPIILDYAHNPVKIEACLQGAREKYPDSQIILVYQPHSYERTASFKEDYCRVFKDADIVLIPNIFSPGRETDEQRAMITAETFVNYLSEQNPEKIFEYTKDFVTTVSKVKKYEQNKKTIVILASAGDLSKMLELVRR